MKNKLIIINVILIIAITALTLIFLIRYYSETPKIEPSCISPNINLTYDACYDIAKKRVSLKITNNENSYSLEKIGLEFKDTVTNTFQLLPIPNKGATEQYFFNSKKNPVKLIFKISLNNALSEICSESTSIILPKSCYSKEISINLNVSGNVSNTPKDILQPYETTLPAIIGKDKFLKVSCKSNWACTDWEECINGIQRRDCTDLSKCLIPIDTPYLARFCDSSCKENWQCEWSKCANGYTQPTCKDINNCNTEYSKPSAISCNNNACAPKISCTDWSDCSISYTFEDLLSGIEELHGKKSRYCTDSNKCILPLIEESYCSIKVDITAEKVTICGKTYLEIRDKLTDKLLSRVDYSKVLDNLNINLFLSEEPITVCQK